MSPEDRMARSKSNEEVDTVNDLSSLPSAGRIEPDSPIMTEPEPLPREEADGVRGQLEEPSSDQLDERNALLESYHHNRVCGLRNCNHGTFSPCAPSGRSPRSSIDSSSLPFGGRYPGDISEDGGPIDTARGILGDSVTDSLSGSKSLSTTRWLAQKHGIKSRRWMYFSYYFPFVKWVRQYQVNWFRGDLIAALTMASFYIPMSLSYAANLGHVPPINGLYSFVFNPLIYAFLGTCPQMVVGPEAAGSLLVGQVVRTCINQGESGDEDGALNAQIAGVVTVMAGSIIFVAGLCRLGFLDSVLSRPFLRGFISAIGFVIFVDQLIPELGLTEVGREAGEISHGSSAQKLVFLARNLGKSHALTAAVSFASFGIIMVFRYVSSESMHAQ